MPTTDYASQLYEQILLIDRKYSKSQLNDPLHLPNVFLHFHEIVEGLYFHCILSVCVSVCLCVRISCEQNSSRTDEPIWTQFSLNGCLQHWLRPYWNWWPWVKGQGHSNLKHVKICEQNADRTGQPSLTQSSEERKETWKGLKLHNMLSTDANYSTFHARFYFTKNFQIFFILHSIVMRQQDTIL